MFDGRTYVRTRVATGDKTTQNSVPKTVLNSDSAAVYKSTLKTFSRWPLINVITFPRSNVPTRTGRSVNAASRNRDMIMMMSCVQ